jgi:2,3-bisphosphoglycerate-dependent phosphoglycerate mutase
MKLLLAMVTTLALAVPAAAQQTIFVVRHAERADASAGASPTMASDPDLSEKGKARAQALATVLKDAKITAIYTTQYKRTVQTADPLARALAIQPTALDARETAGLIEKLKAGGNALVVAHSNTVGPILQQLGVADAITLGDEDYDNIFVVVRSEKPTLIRLHFH